jgi:hypothetical protein
MCEPLLMNEQFGWLYPWICQALRLPFWDRNAMAQVRRLYYQPMLKVMPITPASSATNENESKPELYAVLFM